MGKKTMGFLTLICTVLLFLAAGTLTAADAPESMTMDSKVYSKHTKGLVQFSHKKHADHEGIGCTDCHHVYKDGKNTWKEGDEVQKCETCHSEPAKPKGDKTKMSKAEKIKKYHKDAIHANCKGCHKKMIDKKSEMGMALKKCTGCHPKKK